MNPSTFNAIDKLTASFQNFDLWLYSIKCTLGSCDLWEVCTKEVNAKDPDEKKKDEKAKALIGQACDGSVYPIIMSLETAYETINRLKAHAHGGLKKRLSLIKNFLSNQYNGNIKEYVSKFLATKDALQEVGVPIDDRLLAMFMLAGLSEGFEHLVIKLDNPDVQITTEIVVKALVKEGDHAVPGTSASQQTKSRPRGPKCKKCCQRFQSNRGLRRHITMSMSKGGCSRPRARDIAGPAPPLIKREKPTKQPVPRPFPAASTVIAASTTVASTALSTSNAAPALQQTHPLLNQLSMAKQQVLQRYIHNHKKGMKLSEAAQRYLLGFTDNPSSGFKMSGAQQRILQRIIYNRKEV